MKFEQALQAMREGKRVKLKNHLSQYEIVDSKIWQRIVNVYDGVHLTVNRGFASSDILSEYWEIDENEPQS